MVLLRESLIPTGQHELKRAGVAFPDLYFGVSPLRQQCVNVYDLAVILPVSYTNHMDTVFEVLAEPSRRRILDLLRERERSVGELVERLGLSQPGVSKHLRVLRNAGLVKVRQEAQRRCYGLRAEPLAEMDEWLAPYRKFWAGWLDALEEHLDREE